MCLLDFYQEIHSALCPFLAFCKQNDVISQSHKIVDKTESEIRHERNFRDKPHHSPVPFICINENLRFRSFFNQSCDILRSLRHGRYIHKFLVVPIFLCSLQGWGDLLYVEAMPTRHSLHRFMLSSILQMPSL